MKNFGLSCLLLLSICSFGQGTQASFIDFQRNFTRPGQAMQRKLDTLVKQFAAKNLEWPARYLYIR
ncbi:MAG TPA: hypothetical protein VFL47_14820, partial [Flavisolibacter sp.]|nr:hypothetical protein [Flavisolibacter sp.]